MTTHYNDTLETTLEEDRLSYEHYKEWQAAKDFYALELEEAMDEFENIEFLRAWEKRVALLDDNQRVAASLLRKHLIN